MPDRTVINCYYMDEPLTEEEQEFVGRTLLGPWARFKTGAKSLAQRRVPTVLPTRNADGSFDQDMEERVRVARANLRRAGIGDDRGHQVAWIGARDAHWTGLMMFAIGEETGFAPYFVKRWFLEGEAFVRGEIQIIDGHGLMYGK